ncbi:hypothetical protein HOD29_01245 [archaeon]|jgi:predicted protein tyrosine phosphatase|nr:hypothetical protein [Candidatus Woesearchaeota archaeon]MBT4375979.1 hypothetical protein [archaeon]
MKYLFICQHNFTRSKFGASFFRGFLEGKGIKAKVGSAGIGFVSYFLGRRVNRKIIQRVDWIFVMEGYMKDYFVENFGVDSKKIVVLNIKDEYGFFKRKSIKSLNEIFGKINWEKYL